MLTHRVPFPPDRGDRIRSWNILRHLAQDYDVSLGCVSEEPICPDAKQRLESVCEHVMIAPIGARSKWIRAGASAARGRSLTEGLFWSPSLCKTIDRWSKSHAFDAVLVYCSSMLRYARRKHLRDIPRFVDLVDVDSQKFYEYAGTGPAWKKAIYRTEGHRVRRLEHDAVRSSKAVLLVSDAEASVLRGTLQPAEHPIHGIANGVDTDYFSPHYTTPQPATQNSQLSTSTSQLATQNSQLATQNSQLSSPPLQLAFVGVLNYLPNTDAMLWFAEQVWPTLRQRLPHVQLDVIGKHPTPDVLRLSRLPGIQVTGAVPDVRPYLQAADIVIAPLQIARGVQNKVLEAMAMGRPVIASPAAATGIAAVDGQHLLIADTAAEWVEKISRLAENTALGQQLADDARQLVCHRYTWQATLSQLNQLLTEHLP